MIWEDMLRLFIAMLLGGLIGIEREMTNNPAGFRTHTLVCMGSALVMITSQSVFEVYKDIAVLDPLRLGAQVISGIGFLGAGTILKDGSRIRGLTTAASLWVVACVGLAIGAGFYELAIGASLMAFATLLILKKAENLFSGNIRVIDVMLDKDETSAQIAVIIDTLKKMDIQVRNIRMTPHDKTWIQARVYLKVPAGTSDEQIFEKVKSIEGVSFDV